MEILHDQENKIEVFENDIERCLYEFIESHNIEDMSKESQSKWNAFLMYTRKQVFPDNKVLKDKTLRPLNNGTIYQYSNYNIYNYDLLMEICDIYIYLCLEYDKEISIVGYSLLTGIEQSNIYQWSNINEQDVNKLSYKGLEIYKKLHTFREESLSNKLQGKANPVGILAILNRHYSWNLPGVTKENKQNNALSVENLPKLCAVDVQKGSGTAESKNAQTDSE